MEIKTLQKSNTFSSLATGGQRLGTWFDRRARKLSMKCSKSITLGVVHEHPRIGSDGESEEGSGTSEDPNVSPTSDEIAVNNGKQVGTTEITHVKLRQKPVGLRKLSNQNQEEINKRLSLPADLKLPDNFITRQAASPTLEGPITRYVSIWQ
jgi:hypothetical protein